MPADGVTLHGPLGEFARELSPSDDLHAEEIYAAALSVWSTAIAPTVKVQSYLPGLRPPLVWTAFVGDSWNPPEGPELSVVRALRLRENFTSVAGRDPVTSVVHLFAAVDSARQYPSRHTSALRSTLLHSSPFRWTREGKPQLQSELNHALRQAWDGSNFLRAGTKKRTSVQREQDRIPPMVGALWSIDEGAWNQRPYSPGDDAFYSRFLPFKLRGLARHGRPAQTGPTPELVDAYAWAIGSQREVKLGRAAAERWGEVRALEDSTLLDSPSPRDAAFTIRVGEHTLRVAAALAAAEMSPVIEPSMIDAAWSLVWRSLRDVADLAHADSTLLEDPLAKTSVAVPTDAGSAGVHVEPSWHAESADPDFPDTPVQRRTAVVQAQYRDSRVTRQVKAWYNNTCQFCGTMIELPTPLFAYSEAAHIQALGAPHNGPDRVENVLCLCPNCHVRFDMGARFLTDELRIVDSATGNDLGPLAVHAQHRIRLEYVRQHRSRWAYK
ncbi:HNH endonuclease [Streptomyces sp. SID7958]|uniref:HNH endonuclease n=2 Tax=unclassified Streptomyces TaxID=2593676 RepID=A0A6G3QVP3_9ACTN|nr:MULTISPECIES: HNH endonuclease [unclassified Streptomyces]NEA87568.1 HNH endonuclease [Streptomyces sp. SID14436]NEC82065.1 HNH endonuclease [Streptomyces sp. SID7958]